MCLLRYDEQCRKQTDISLVDIEAYTPTGSVNSGKKETHQSQHEKIDLNKHKDLFVLTDLKFKHLNTFGDENEHPLSNLSSPKFPKFQTSVKQKKNENENLNRSKISVFSKRSFKEDEKIQKQLNEIKINQKILLNETQEKDKIKEIEKNKKKFNSNMLFTHNDEQQNFEEVV